MMNKYPIVVLVLLLGGIALILNCASSGNCGINCSGNCGENCTCPNADPGIQNNSTEENCSALGSCPIKALSTGEGR